MAITPVVYVKPAFRESCERIGPRNVDQELSVPNFGQLEHGLLDPQHLFRGTQHGNRDRPFPASDECSHLVLSTNGYPDAVNAF